MTRSILLLSLDDPTRQLFQLWSKNRSFDGLMNADHGFGKGHFLNRSNKSIYEPISKRIVDSERPRDQ